MVSVRAGPHDGVLEMRELVCYMWAWEPSSVRNRGEYTVAYIMRGSGCARCLR